MFSSSDGPASYNPVGGHHTAHGNSAYRGIQGRGGTYSQPNQGLYGGVPSAAPDVGPTLGLHSWGSDRGGALGQSTVQQPSAWGDAAGGSKTSPVGAGAALRRHQTLLFWDCDTMSAASLQTTNVHMFRRMKEFLTEKKILIGSVRAWAYTLAHNPSSVAYFDDLQIPVYTSTTKPQLQAQMSSAIAQVRTQFNPVTDDIAVVIVSKDKSFVRDIKDITDAGFDLILIHDALPQSSLAEILETYTTKSFAAKDIVAVPPSAANASSKTASEQQSPTSQPSFPNHHHHPHHTAASAGTTTLLVEGRRVPVEDVIMNEMVTNAIRQVSSGIQHSALRWCPNPVPHPTRDCPAVHPIVMTGASSVPPPPSYNQAVQHLSKSPMITPSSGAPTPPLAAGSSPITSFFPVSTPPHGPSSRHGLASVHLSLPPPVGGNRSLWPSEACETAPFGDAPLPPPPPPSASSITSFPQSTPKAVAEPTPQSVEALLTLLSSNSGNSSNSNRGSGLLLDDGDDDIAAPTPNGALHVDPAIRQSLASLAEVLTSTIVVEATPSLEPVVQQEICSEATATETTPSEKKEQPKTAVKSAAGWGKVAVTTSLALNTPEDDAALPGSVEDLPTLESLASSALPKKLTASPLPGKQASAPPKASFASIVGNSAAASPGKGGKSDGKAAPAPPPKKAVVKMPKEINIEGHMIPVDTLVPNKFLEACLKTGSFSGRWCSNTFPHSMIECTSAHRDRYPLLQGGEVEGKTLLSNTALENLRKNTSYKGNFCTSTRPHDASKCTYLHRKN